MKGNKVDDNITDNNTLNNNIADINTVDDKIDNNMRK